MRNISILLSFFLLITSCGLKQTQKMVASGDYDNAIENAVSSLQNNKERKGKQEYIYLLEDAFAKAKERDLRSIDLLIKDANPSNLEKVFNTYLQLNNRQEKIRPLLPLTLLKEGRTATFTFYNYSDEIISSKNALSKYLYSNTKALLVTNNKMNFRRAYDDLIYLESINPNFKDVHKLMEEAKNKGIDYVTVYSKNETNMIIPIRLENDLLDFSTYGLNDKWSVFHSNKQKGINYDYGIVLNFRQLSISPEQIKEKEFNKEKQIKIGQKKLLDARGNVVKDSEGNPIMVDDFKTVKISVYEFRQFKSAQVVAKVDYIDLKNNQLLQTFPISSEFIFENVYANYKGDKQACEQEYYPNFDRRAVVFPTNEQMIMDTSEDLKTKLKAIITQNKIRK